MSLPDGGEIWHGGGDLWSPPPCQISPPSVQRVAPAGEKPQNRSLSKLNIGRFALRAMLPVIKTHSVNTGKYSSHHMQKTDAGLKGPCIREITSLYDFICTKHTQTHAHKVHTRTVFFGGLGPHLTQRRLRQGPPPCQVAS